MNTSVIISMFENMSIEKLWLCTKKCSY